MTIKRDQTAKLPNSMKQVPLGNGAVVFEICMKVVVTKFDLVAVGCWAIHNQRLVRSRKQLTKLLERMIESQGILGIVRSVNKHKQHKDAATLLVDGLYPELNPTPTAPMPIPASLS